MSNTLLLDDGLRFSDKFALAFDARGEAVFYRFTNPEYNVRVSEAALTLALCFPTNRTVPVRTALELFFRRAGLSQTEALLSSLLSTARELVGLGVLTRGGDPEIMYTGEMVPSYLRSRHIPAEITELIAKEAPITSETMVLDIGTGTGDIALGLAEHSQNVTGIDICEPFLDAAKEAALRRGVTVALLH